MLKPVNRNGNVENREKDMDQITGVVSLTFINSMIRRMAAGEGGEDETAPKKEFIEGYI